LTGWSRQIHSRFHGPAATREMRTPYRHAFTYGTLTLSGRPFQAIPLTRAYNAGRGSNRTHTPTTPHTQPLPGLTRMRFSHLRVRSPLLTESQLFSLPAGTEMFHFPTFPPRTLYIQMRVTRHHACWVPPFGHPRITARLAAPRGLSQPPTSFIGSWCQGIHRVLLHAYIQHNN